MNKKYLKQGFKPLLQIFLFSVIILSPYTLFSEDIIKSINANYDFDNIKYFYNKTISDTLGIEIGTIKGKIIYSQDSIVLYAITKKDTRYIKYKDGIMIVKEKNKSKKTKIKDIPNELNIKKMFNPLLFINKYQYTDSIHILRIVSKQFLFDTMIVYYDSLFLIDSLILKKDNNILSKTIYSHYKNNIPMNIITIDYIRNIKEKIFNYGMEF